MTPVNKILMCKLSGLPVGTAVEKRILARRIAVFNVDGTLVGLESECKHMKASLATGGVKEGILTCQWHGWKYDLATGECLGRPGMKLKRYEVLVEGDNVFLVL